MNGKEIENKIKKLTTDICYILELITAVMVLIGVVIALIGMIPDLGDIWLTRGDTEGFLTFLEKALFIVVGVEFIKMLCKPTSDNVLETIIFLVARHMIVTTSSTPVEDLISTISIILLCLMRRYLKVTRDQDTLLIDSLKKNKSTDESNNQEQESSK